MQAQQRMAMGERLQQLLENGTFHELGQIALTTGLVTAGQLAAGADPGAVALAAILGGAVSIPARPVAGAMGHAVGRGIDAHQARHGQPHEFLRKHYDGFSRGIPGTNSNIKMHLAKGTVQTPMGVQARAMAHAHQKKPDGTRRGYMEGDLGLMSRTYGDNVAQALVQIAAPGVFAAAEPPAGKDNVELTR